MGLKGEKRNKMKKEEVHLNGTKRKTVKKLVFGRNRQQTAQRAQVATPLVGTSPPLDPPTLPADLCLRQEG